MKARLVLMFALLLAALPIMVSPSVPSAHASPATGTVCITTSTSATSCPSSPPTLGPLTVGDNFTVSVFVQGSDAMGGFDIFVASDQAYLDPTNATLGTLIASPSLTNICIKGVSTVGSCTPNSANGPGVVEVSTVESSGNNECGSVSPCSGMAFNITYQVIGSVASTSLFYPSNPSCSMSSVSSPQNVCVLVADNTGTPLSENIQGAAVQAPAFDYSLSNNGPVSIAQGNSGTVTITATLTDGAAKSVTLSCVSSSLPAGITCGSFTVNPVTPTASSVLTINVGSSVVPGSYSLDVTGSPLGVTTTPTTVSLKVSLPTTTSVACSPSSITTGTATSCTVTVTDTSSNPSTPTGSVSLSTDSTGTFSSNSCTLATSSSSAASCSVSYTPSVVGSGTHLITANYSGDSSHASSNGSSPLTVTSAATAPTILGLSPTVFYIIVGIAVIVLAALSLLALRRRGRTPQQ